MQLPQNPVNELMQFFQHLIEHELLNGYQLIHQKMKQSQTFAKQCIEMLSNDEQYFNQNSQLYFNIITMIHPVLVEMFSTLPTTIQSDIRSGLLNAVISLHTQLRCIAALGLCIREIVEIDSIQPWLQPFEEIIRWATDEDIAAMQAGIQFFIWLLKQTSYSANNNDLPFHQVAPLLLQNLFQMFANSELGRNSREKLLYLVLQLIKTFAMLDGYQDNIVKQCLDATYEIWMSLFISILQSTLQTHLLMKKYIMKIIVILFRDMPNLTQQHHKTLGQLYPIWQFCYQIMPLYAWMCLWQQPASTYCSQSDNCPQINSQIQVGKYYDDDYESHLPVMQGLVHAILQFLSVMISTPHLNNCIKISLHHLVNVLFHYMLMSQFEVKNWKNNPTHFIIGNTSIDHDANIRSKALSILNELIEKYSDFTIQTILLICQKFLINFPEEKTTASMKNVLSSMIDMNSLSDLSLKLYEDESKMVNLMRISSCDIRRQLGVSGETWKKMEVALVVLGRFSQDIIVFQSKQQQTFDILSFIQGMIKQIQHQDTFALLKGQSIHCLTRFTEIISIKFKQEFLHLFCACLNCLSNLPMPIIITTIRAMSIFLRKIDKHSLSFSTEQLKIIADQQPTLKIVSMQPTTDVVNLVLQGLVQLTKNQQIKQIITKPNAKYLLCIFHQNISHNSTMQLFFTLLNHCCDRQTQFLTLFNEFSEFIYECLKAYRNIVSSEQKNYLKTVDIELIKMVLKMADILIVRAKQINKQVSKQIIPLLLLLTETIVHNQQISIHISITVCLKNIIKLDSHRIKQCPSMCQGIVNTIHNLFKIPADKTFEAASVYAGNLMILSQQLLLPKLNYELLQQAVLKVFRSRTPSVIQSLVLIYSQLMNLHTNNDNVFKTDKNNIIDIIDFLASFSIENRMGLKILVDKWLLQQSLFRGKYAKISTFMALSQLFLIRDKRVDNLLVIGFNPSHTNVNNDVNAPLKILATLIRCLDNEMGGSKENQSEDEGPSDHYLMKEQVNNTVSVDLEKFKEDQQETQEVVGGLADRENQQGSTCYMSAMLQFYDDGEECDQTTEEDLLFLHDSSTFFNLSEYLISFFQHLVSHHQQYFHQCLKDILKQDYKTLQKYIKLN